MARGNKINEYRTFINRAVRQPGTVGAVLPTSRPAGRAMTDIIPDRGSPTVVELGPGTGALSDVIRDRLPAGGRQLAVEIDPELVRYLREAKPWLRVVEGDAAELRTLLEAEGHTPVDAVVSSIPWTLLPARDRAAILRQIGRSLTPDGAFTAITYLTALVRRSGREFEESLRDAFDEVVPRSAVWRNVPPARIYVCRRPRHDAATS